MRQNVHTQTSALAHQAGRDRDLYELMQALEVMVRLLPKFHSPPNTAAIALRDLIVHFVHITSLLFKQSLPQEA